MCPILLVIKNMQTTGSWPVSTRLCPESLHVTTWANYTAWILKWEWTGRRKQKLPVPFEAELRTGVVSFQPCPHCLAKNRELASIQREGKICHPAMWGVTENLQPSIIHHIFPPPSNIYLSKTSSIIKVHCKFSLFYELLTP